MKNRNRFLLLIAMLSIGLAPSLAPAQDLSTTGSIGGKVTDVNGAALANANVTVTGVTGDRSVNTKEDGTFEVQNLNPGEYSVKATQSGFKTALVSRITVNVGKVANLQLKLEPGEISATVDITDTASGIDQQTTAVGQSLNDPEFKRSAIPKRSGSTQCFQSVLSVAWRH
jgi:hypothetical protein